jgi:hypothetical protein
MKLLKVQLLAPSAGSAPSSKPRVHAISFGPPRTLVTHISWVIPSGWAVDKPPSAMTSDCSLASEATSIRVQDSTITCETTATYRGGSMPPVEYNSAREFIASHNAVNGLRLSLKGK